MPDLLEGFLSSATVDALDSDRHDAVDFAVNAHRSHLKNFERQIHLLEQLPRLAVLVLQPRKRRVDIRQVARRVSAGHIDEEVSDTAVHPRAGHELGVCRARFEGGFRPQGKRAPLFFETGLLDESVLPVRHLLLLFRFLRSDQYLFPSDDEKFQVA